MKRSLELSSNRYFLTRKFQIPRTKSQINSKFQIPMILWHRIGHLFGWDPPPIGWMKRFILHCQIPVWNFEFSLWFAICYLEFIPFYCHLYFLTFWADMRAALPHDDPYNGCFTARAGEIRAAKNLQFIFVAPSMTGQWIEIGLAGAQRRSQIF